jgi:hypothetical protein
LKRAKDKIKRDGHFITKHGKVHSAFDDRVLIWSRHKRRAKVANAIGLGVPTFAKLKGEMVANTGIGRIGQ